MKFYKLVNTEGLTYIGKTSYKYLSRRLAIHKSQAKTKRPINKCSSAKLFENSEVKIYLLEESDETDKKILGKIELKYIESYDCVNIMKSGLDYKETKKNWLKKNPNYYKEYNKTDKCWHRKKFTCVCGAVIQNGAKYRHMKTKYHLKYIENNASNSQTAF